jgi:hypothetical protein
LTLAAIWLTRPAAVSSLLCISPALVMCFAVRHAINYRAQLGSYLLGALAFLAVALMLFLDEAKFDSPNLGHVVSSAVAAALNVVALSMSSILIWDGRLAGYWGIALIIVTGTAILLSIGPE